MNPPQLHSMTEQAHRHLSPCIQEGDIVVDATCGNGHDTHWLAQQAGPSGEIYAVDIQTEAIQASKKRNQEHKIEAKIHWIQQSHENWEAILPEEHKGKIKAFVYNLGYLPGADKNLTTRAEFTVSSVLSAVDWLCPGGRISLCVYRGHPEGIREYQAVSEALSQISKSNIHAAEYHLINHDKDAPVLIIIERA